MSDAMFEDGWGEPSNERKRVGYNFLHVPARGRIEVVCLVDAPVVFRAHWNGRIMEPCVGEKCSYDHSKFGTQRRWVFGVLDLQGRQTSLLEVGPAVAEVFQLAQEAAGGLRGLAFKLWKESGSLRGRISCQCTVRTRLREEDMPPEPNLREILLRVWKDQTR